MTYSPSLSSGFEKTQNKSRFLSSSGICSLCTEDCDSVCGIALAAVMKDLKKNCRVAVIQAAPVMFDKAACIDKAVSLIAESAADGAELIVFPELFIPGYPFGLTFGFTVGSRNEDGRKDWKLYYDNSVVVPGPETGKLCAAAKAAGA